jgi:hypothetical protein
MSNLFYIETCIKLFFVRSVAKIEFFLVAKIEAQKHCKSFPLYVQIATASAGQGCQMIYFKTKNTNLGIFWRALEWKMLVYFTATWYNLWPFGICNVWPFGFSLWSFGIYFLILVCLDREKSGNPAAVH